MVISFEEDVFRGFWRVGINRPFQSFISALLGMVLPRHIDYKVYSMFIDVRSRLPNPGGPPMNYMQYLVNYSIKRDGEINSCIHK